MMHKEIPPQLLTLGDLIEFFVGLFFETSSTAIVFPTLKM